MIPAPLNAAPARSPWFSVPRPHPAARHRLICFPHAGAGASAYFPWAAALQPHGIELRTIQYPGREARLAELRITETARMVAALADLWPQLTGGAACALYGHSMGALLAHELTLELVRRGVSNLPTQLIFSGRNPPHAPPRLPAIRHLADREFIQQISARYGNMPAALLENPEMLALLTPILRADFTLVETYAWTPAPALPIPLSVLGGTEDPWTTPAELEGWRDYTTAPSRVRVIAGDHFFIQSARADVLAAIVADLASSAAPRLIPTA